MVILRPDNSLLESVPLPLCWPRSVPELAWSSSACHDGELSHAIAPAPAAETNPIPARAARRVALLHSRPVVLHPAQGGCRSTSRDLLRKPDQHVRLARGSPTRATAQGANVSLQGIGADDTITPPPSSPPQTLHGLGIARVAQRRGCIGCSTQPWSLPGCWFPVEQLPRRWRPSSRRPVFRLLDGLGGERRVGSVRCPGPRHAVNVDPGDVVAWSFPHRTSKSHATVCPVDDRMPSPLPVLVGERRPPRREWRGCLEARVTQGATTPCGSFLGR